MIINTNLYPPIIDTYMPAFIISNESEADNTCRVYFSFSSYNTIGDIKNAQVVVYDQNTNVSVLNDTKYPCGIMLTQIYEDIERQSTDRYYITINKTDLINNTFENNKYYKFQIRFTGAAAPNVELSTPQAIDSWLAANQSAFSEWSTICLIRGISKPTLTLKGIDTSAALTIWTSSHIDIIGQLTFADPNETERLKSYRIKLFNSGNELVIDSGDIYSNNFIGINELNYTLKYIFQDGESYYIEVTYTTNNLYTQTSRYSLMIIQEGAEKLDATISAKADEENGRIDIRIKSEDEKKYTGNIMIRRSSNKSNYTIWEDMHLARLEGQILDFNWHDDTVESGVWYQYCAQEINSLGQRSLVIKTKNPVLVTLDHIFLNDGQCQLCVKFNPNVSSYQRTVLEAKTDTIGSQYPFIKRNGYTNYRQFSISGTISHFMDENGLFTTKDKIYDETTLRLFEEYNEENRISADRDFTYERDFREKVLDFLYENKVKLFRSPTEGNILVKLMGISCSPNVTLGRMIYDFSCTAYEVADLTMDNLLMYGIQTIDDYTSEFISYTRSYIGQVNDAIPANTNVLDILQEKYQNSAINKDYKITVDYLDYVKIEMQGEPYLITEGANGPTPASKGAIDAISGYIVNINNKPIVINADGIYELKGDNIQITSITFPVETNAMIDYNAFITESEDVSSIPVVQNYYSKVGQRWGTFEYGDSVYKQIWDKYYEKYSTYTQTLNAINGINVESDPGVVIYVREAGESSFDRHVLNESGTLTFYDENTVIEGLYFAGVHLDEATDAELDRNEVPANKFVETGIEVANVEEITNPVFNGVYTITNPVYNTDTVAATQEDENGTELYNQSIYSVKDNEFKQKALVEANNSNRYIWYNSKWHSFTSDNDVVCSIDGLVDYYFEIMKGLYV